MVDDAELTGLNPFDLLDREAGRLDAYFSADPAPEWSRPSRCAGWSIRDVLAHLAASEEYHRACLEGEVQAFVQSLSARGAANIDQMNALGIAEREGRSTEQLLTEWREADAQTRRGFRDRDDGLVDTSVGDYPCRWQAFHVAGELAVHADDIFVPVTPEEREERRTWRVRFSRFALAEAKPEVVLSVEAGRTRVVGEGIDARFEDDEFIEGVAGRLDDSSRLEPAVRALLSTMP